MPTLPRPARQQEALERLRCAAAESRRPWYMLTPFGMPRKIWDTVRSLRSLVRRLLGAPWASDLRVDSSPPAHSPPMPAHPQVAIFNIWLLLAIVPISIAFIEQVDCLGGGDAQRLAGGGYVGATDKGTRVLFYLSVYTTLFFAADVALNFLTGHYDATTKRVDYRLGSVA